MSCFASQIYLPVPNNKHWILLLITISRTMVEIYDSLRTYKRGDDPYDDLWKTIVRSYELDILLLLHYFISAQL
jgi:Ulp1 family protease